MLKKYGMETCFMYHCLRIQEQECTRTRYEGRKIILEIKKRKDKLLFLYCPKYKSRQVIKSSTRLADAERLANLTGSFQYQNLVSIRL